MSKGDAVNNNKFQKNFQQCFLPKALDGIKMSRINNWLNERSHRVGVNDLCFTIEVSTVPDSVLLRVFIRDLGKRVSDMVTTGA